jgi:hypothetical protein
LREPGSHQVYEKRDVIVSSKSLTGKTTEKGLHHLMIEFYGSYQPARPISISALAEIIDLNHQFLKTNKNFILHCSEYYVGLKAAATATLDQTFEIELVVTNHNGELIPDVDVTVIIKKFSYRSPEEETIQLRSTSFPTKLRLEMKKEKYSSFTSCDVTASIEDRNKQTHRSRINFAVQAAPTSPYDYWGLPKPAALPYYDNTISKISVTASKETYQIGENADLTIVSTFAPCDGKYIIAE